MANRVKKVLPLSAQMLRKLGLVRNALAYRRLSTEEVKNILGIDVNMQTLALYLDNVGVVYDKGRKRWQRKGGKNIFDMIKSLEKIYGHTGTDSDLRPSD